MLILYDENRKTHDIFSYTINRGGKIRLKVSNVSDRSVTITFVNGRFNNVEHDLVGDWVGTRSYWHVMGGIAEKIAELEKRFSAKNSRD